MSAEPPDEEEDLEEELGPDPADPRADPDWVPEAGPGARDLPPAPRAETEENAGTQRDYIAKLKTGERIERKTDMGLSAGFEALKGKLGGYVSDKKFLNGWTYGTQSGLARICLLWVDGKGKRGVEKFDFEHYFWMRTEDIKGRALTLLRRWVDGGLSGPRRFRVRSWAPDATHPAWTRVFVDCPPEYFNTKSYIADREGHYVTNVKVDGKDRRIKATAPSLLIAEELHSRCEVETFEADLSPLRRFVADNPIDYPEAGDFSETYFDIETDDRNDDTFSHLGKYRILSIAWEDKDGLAGGMVLEDDSDDAERRMLKRFRDKVLSKTDVLFSWNGYTFDYFYLYERMRRMGVEWKWWELVFADLLPVFKRYHFRAGSKNTSLALGAIGKAVLGTEAGAKVDLKSRLDQECPEWRGDHSAAGTWSAWHRAPELLLEYNIGDCTVLRKLEAFCGYAHLDFTFSKIGNCFANDYHISTKVDGLMVRKGLMDGHHFPTVYKADREAEADTSFEGGYVHDPVRGVHHEVCAFDFKSLYPSMMTTFNISPDTFVPEEERHLHRPEDLITNPYGTTFLRPVKTDRVDAQGRAVWERVGFIPQMFRETLERRKTYTNLQGTVEVGSDMFLHYYRLAYSYKRLGLSFYGELGNRRGRYYAPLVGASVTMSGQHFIKGTMAYSAELGHRPLYGDTDSMYIQLPREEGVEFVRKCQVLYYSWLEGYNAPVERCNIELEYEDVYGYICLINKKRYFGHLSWHKGQPASHLEIKGLESMRSDGLALARTLQMTLMHAMAFEDADASRVLAIVEKERARVLGGECSTEEVLCVSGLSKEPAQYKHALPPHVRVVLGLKATGEEYYVGMKVPYVWCVGTHVPRPDFDPALSFVANVRALEAWREAEEKASRRRSKPPEPTPVYAPNADGYDRAFYWDRKVYPPSLRILEVAYPEVDWHALSAEESGKRTRRLSAYRRDLLNPAKREAACAKIAGDPALTSAQRDELTRFYLSNVLTVGRG